MTQLHILPWFHLYCQSYFQLTSAIFRAFFPYGHVVEKSLVTGFRHQQIRRKALEISFVASKGTMNA